MATDTSVLAAPRPPGDHPPSSPPHATTTSPHAALPRTTLPALAAGIVAGIARAHERVTLQLQPADLGRVEVMLRVDDAGRLHAAFTVERPETLQSLQRDASGLEQTLAGSGLQLASGGLSFGLRQENGQGGGGPPWPHVASPAVQPVRERTPSGTRAIDRLLDLSV